MSQRWKDEVRTWLYLVRVVEKIERQLEAHVEQYGLTPPQFEVLAQLQRTPHIVQQQLADRLRMSKGNVVGILNRLEQAGFVMRQIHPEDGRAYLLCLTERGATLISQVLPEHEALIIECLNRLPPPEREQLHDALRRLNRALGPK
jgi:DNA-binding MarR family transcriptional regulator